MEKVFFHQDTGSQGVAGRAALQAGRIKQDGQFSIYYSAGADKDGDAEVGDKNDGAGDAEIDARRAASTEEHQLCT